MLARRCLHLVVALAAAVATILVPSAARAQVDLDRIVGETIYAQPLVITELNGVILGRLAYAAGTPMGFEGLPDKDVFHGIKATGMKLREVLATLVAADPRFEWRQDAGVIIFRPRASWAMPNGLETRVGPVDLKQVDQSDALRAVARVFGSEVSPSNGDALRFSVSMPQGGTILDLLNHVVRAHGRLAWAVEYMEPQYRKQHPYKISLLNGNGGTGVGIRREAMLAPPVPVPIKSRPLPEDVASIPVLDRIVGPTPGGNPLTVMGVIPAVPQLAAATQTPMGLEQLPPGKVPPQPRRPGFSGITVTGMRLRDALSVLEELSPAYEWRLIDGVVVFRPKTAWADADDPLFKPMPAKQFPEASLNDAMGEVDVLFGNKRRPAYSFADTKRFRIDAQPTLLDFLNAVAKGHGDMSWRWEEVDASDPTAMKVRYLCVFATFAGGGLGHGIE